MGERTEDHTARTLNDLARHKMILRLYQDILINFISTA